MSYPEPRYLGEKGGVSALFRPGAPREEYFGKAAEHPQRSPEKLEAFRAGHDQYTSDRRQ